MPLFSRSGRSVMGRTVGTGIRATRLLLRGSVNGGRWMTRRAGSARAKGAGGETGMVRLFDLHAVSCAGDTLIAIGLAGTIFFDVPLGEARSKVALYLLVTMVPFAMLAPVVGPLLDHFRHGRRYALATTMLGRAFLAWLISDYIGSLGLYPAAFGVLALSRAYGVARSAAVPRLLPEGLGLSQVGARASVYGTVAGALVVPLGLAAFWFGPQWPLRVASVIFLVGMVIALRLPPRADSEPPERVPRPLRALRRKGDRPLGRGRPAGRLVIATLIGAAGVRALYGFLLLFLAFALKKGDLTNDLFGRQLSDQAALGIIGGALAIGGFLATAVGTRLRIHRPAAIQSSTMIIVAGVGILTVLKFSLPMVALFCLVAALSSGIAKLAVDASIQERIPERLRASSFAHSETALMLAFVAGGGLGLVPFEGRIGIAVAAGVGVLAAVRGVVVAGRLRAEQLLGRPLTDEELAAQDRTDAAAARTADPAPGVTAPADTAAGSTDTTAGRSAGARADLTAGHLADSAADEATEAAARAAPTSPAPSGAAGVERHDDGLAPPGYHIYRPSSAVPGNGSSADDQPRQSPGSVS
ncbi:Major Facilitator Superfamily protein [Micromonospora matsumotoense]|uniref:Major Facilitator Superfamily protein n=1 Tax=Micromonospora matsumotoense TaxID=121616 RepID=A0A1C4XYT4_9ACTN|nr:MFS transporter [Micromonospora matsumotoense]SCF13620.1 Major Facilitator Superfamily protein [Micromonospora matsumotoense]